MSHQSILRITRELSDLQKGEDLSLAITYDDSDIRNVKALIVGPPGTPYEFGFVEVSTSSLSNCGCTMYDNVLPRMFSVKFPEGYPANPQKVTALTSNCGRCRFAPNIYANGKVCLSILGKSILASENTKSSEGDVAMEDDEEERESYQSFDDLRKHQLMKETMQWTDEGLMAKKDDLGIASNLSLQYQQILEDFNERKYFSLDLSLVDGNPFTWDATYFGRPGTHLDGSVFNIMIHLSPRFPQEQPRVFFKTPVFHHHVSKMGCCVIILIALAK
ncbi:Ubiquitin-conjugating enzyme, E2 [Penicillium occitanis (nom. inval.)]|nr:Ubiquitin-conjugating enzyme, E2 [Penicillium occitanis (nom. inval.)]PCG91861.1 hypothetical protein PENOC_095400 [Penicillium occitanis (nom. inval.)]